VLRRRRIESLVVLLAACMLQCSSSSSNNSGDPSTSTDPTESKSDNGAPSSTYPAFRPTYPQVLNSGGKVLASPKYVAITFAGDPLVADIDRFTSMIGTSDYWHTTTSEYGVGPATGAAVHVTETAPQTIDDSDISKWLVGKIDGNAPGFAPPDDGTVYAIFYPEQTAITNSGVRSCDVFAGYHAEAALASGQHVPYAVFPRCQPDAGAAITDLEILTVAASHEYIESATDPFPDSGPAYLETTDFYGLPLLVNEVGDICDLMAVATETADEVRPDSGLPYLVQRTWSNAAANAGRNPCVPSTGPYFNAVPVTTDMLSTTQAFGHDIRGFKISAGDKRVIEIDLLSDGPTNGPFDVSVEDITPLNPDESPPLDVSLDRKSGLNGEKLHLTVTVASDTSIAFAGFRLQSTQGNQEFVWYGLVQIAGN
jgi:hypothetical protein